MDNKALLHEGKILFASGQPEKSIPYFTAAMEQGADPVIAGLSRGTANMAIQCYEEAKEDFSRVLNVDPDNERAYYYRGVSEVALGEFDAAIKDLTRSLAKNHRRGIAYLARGLAYVELGNEKDAELDFNSASAFSADELESFLKIFNNHPSLRTRALEMLKRQSAPWKALLTQTDVNRLKRSV